MAEEYGYIQAFKHSRQYQTKFEYFFIGVILASLSLSVQLKFPEDIYSVYLLISTWSLLLISFLSGLFRFERINMYFRIEADKLSFHQKKKNIENANLQDQTLYKTSTTIWRPDELINEISRLDNLLESSENFIKTFNNQSLIAYQVQKWCFIYAIFSFALFRITNLFHFSVLIELSSIGVLIIGSIILVWFYKKSLPYSDKKTIEKLGKCRYKCKKCGQIVELDDASDTLPPCPKCNKTKFIKL